MRTAWRRDLLLLTHYVMGCLPDSCRLPPPTNIHTYWWASRYELTSQNWPYVLASQSGYRTSEASWASQLDAMFQFARVPDGGFCESGGDRRRQAIRQCRQTQSIQATVPRARQSHLSRLDSGLPPARIPQARRPDSFIRRAERIVDRHTVQASPSEHEVDLACAVSW